MKHISLLLLICSSLTFAQEFSKAIEDNSYYIEEAYNQEDRVVQHIINGVTMTPGNLLETSFTQEWPAFGQKHQLSFTLPFIATTGITLSSQGIGDLMINYRYQLIREGGIAISPRVSLILPSGDETKGTGNGVVGFQLNLPVSKRFTNEFVTHYNAGLTVLPNVKLPTTQETNTVYKETITEYFFGVSGIYLVQPTFNVMTEVLYTSSGSASGRTNELIVSPGLRWAIDVSDLQIVPGLAFPFSFSSDVRPQTNGYFLYVSFEHPY